MPAHVLEGEGFDCADGANGSLQQREVGMLVKYFAPQTIRKLILLVYLSTDRLNFS